MIIRGESTNVCIWSHKQCSLTLEIEMCDVKMRVLKSDFNSQDHMKYKGRAYTPPSTNKITKQHKHSFFLSPNWKCDFEKTLVLFRFKLKYDVVYKIKIKRWVEKCALGFYLGPIFCPLDQIFLLKSPFFYTLTKPTTKQNPNKTIDH